MNEEEIKLNIQEILKRPLIDKIKHMHKEILGNIECIFKESENCNHPIEHARYNGQVYAFTLCRGMVEAILRLEDRRCGCGSLVDEEEKDSSSRCMDCKRKILG
jgi:hypothetical protein